MRLFILIGCILLFMLSCRDTDTVYQSRKIKSNKQIFPPDFNFWLGGWNNNWSTRTPDSTWLLYDNVKHKVYQFLDGKLIVEFAQADTANVFGYITSGVSMRYFDQENKKWVMSQTWPDSRNGMAFSELKGQDDHGRIEMFNERVYQGDSIKVRYTFSDIKENSFRWDNAYTKDKGVSWNALSIARFDRLNPYDSIKNNFPPFQKDTVKLAIKPKDTLIIAQHYVRNNWKDSFDVLNGLGTIYVDENSSLKIFNYLVFDYRDKSLKRFIINNKIDSKHIYVYGDIVDKQILWYSDKNKKNPTGEIWNLK